MRTISEIIRISYSIVHCIINKNRYERTLKDKPGRGRKKSSSSETVLAWGSSKIISRPNKLKIYDFFLNTLFKYRFNFKAASVALTSCSTFINIILNFK